MRLICNPTRRYVFEGAFAHKGVILPLLLAEVVYGDHSFKTEMRPYRIRESRRTEDDLEEQIEETLKLSTHLRTSQRGGQRASSAKPRRNLAETQQQMSRMTESHARSGYSGLNVDSRVGRMLKVSRVEKKPVVEMEFNNARWLSMVSAYDNKRLKHCTLSKKACQDVFRRYGPSMKKDPHAKYYFHDIKKHFRQWLAKINALFTAVLNEFLSQGQDSSSSQLKQVGPVLEQVRQDSAMMEEKLKTCLREYENGDMRRLLARYHSYHTFSQRLERLLQILAESRERIDELFINMEDNSRLDSEVRNIESEGMGEARDLIEQENDRNPDLTHKILEKVAKALTEHARRSINIFHKVKGARQMLERLERLLLDSRRQGLSREQIRDYSQLFKGILDEADRFEEFAQQVDTGGEEVSEQLRAKILEYKENIAAQRASVSSMQLTFVQNIIRQTVEVLVRNYRLNQCVGGATSDNYATESAYHLYNRILEEISDAMLDHTRRTHVETLIKYGRIHFVRLEEQVQKVTKLTRDHRHGIVIDTESGETTVLRYAKIIKDYKEKTKNLIRKHQNALKAIDPNDRVSPVDLPDEHNDLERVFIERLSDVTRIVSGHERREKLKGQRGFASESEGIVVGAKEAEATRGVVMELIENREKMEALREENPLDNLISRIVLENNIYLECNYLCDMYQTVDATSERSIFSNVGKLADIDRRRERELTSRYTDYHMTPHYSHLVQKIYCLMLKKGLRARQVAELDDPDQVKLPESATELQERERVVKEMKTLGREIGERGSFVKASIKAGVVVMEDMVKAYWIVQKLKENRDDMFLMPVASWSAATAKFFKLSLVESSSEDAGEQGRRVLSSLVKEFKKHRHNLEEEENDAHQAIVTLSALLPIKNEVLRLSKINSAAIDQLEGALRSSGGVMGWFSLLLHAASQYVFNSGMLAYVGLNQLKQPIWIGEVEQEKEGISGQINLKGYKRGQMVDKYVREPPAVKPHKEEVAKEGKKKKESRGEYMEEDFEDEAMEEVMADEMEEEMAEEMDEDMPDEDMAEDVPDDMDEDFPSQQEQPLEEDFEEDQSEVKPKTKAMVQPQKQKKPAQEKSQPKKEVKKSNYKKSYYQVIPHFRELEQIRDLFRLIDSTEGHFWSSEVDFQEVEAHYHSSVSPKQRSNFVKALQTSFEAMLGQRFKGQLGTDLKGLERFKQTKESFGRLGEQDFGALMAVLDGVYFNYSVMEAEGKVLQISIRKDEAKAAFKKESSINCVVEYIDRTFKSPFYSKDGFEWEEYAEGCFQKTAKERHNDDFSLSHCVVTYRVKPNSPSALPSLQVEQELERLDALRRQLTDSLVTGINYHDYCVELWLRALQAEEDRDFYKPDYSTLTKYTKELSVGDSKSWIGHYLTEFRQKTLEGQQQGKQLKQKLENLLFKADPSSILKCIGEIKHLVEPIVSKEVKVESSMGQSLVCFETSQEGESRTKQSQLSGLIEAVLCIKSEEKSKVLVGIGLIAAISSHFGSSSPQSSTLYCTSQLLTIFKVEHYVMKQPQFLLKPSLEAIIMTVLANLGVSSQSEVDYDALVKEVFYYDRADETECFNVKLRGDYNQQMFSKQSVQKWTSHLKEIQEQLKARESAMKDMVKKEPLSSLVFDCFAEKNNKIVQVLREDYEWVSQTGQQLKTQMADRKAHPLLYASKHQKTLEQAQSSVAQRQQELLRLVEILDQTPLVASSIGRSSVRNSNVRASNQGGSAQLLFQLKKANEILVALCDWGVVKQLSPCSVVYWAVVGEERWAMGAQFTQNTRCDKVKGRVFLSRVLEEYWLRGSQCPKTEWEAVFEFLYKGFLEQNISVSTKGDRVSVELDFKAAAKALGEAVEREVAQPQEIVSFGRSFNRVHFEGGSQHQQALQEGHRRIEEGLKEKLRLAEAKQLVSAQKWGRVSLLGVVDRILLGLKEMVTYSKEEVQGWLEEHSRLRLRDTDPSHFAQWYQRIAVGVMKLGYFQLVSSKGESIATLPVAKVEKDRSKNEEAIGEMLAEIGLPRDKFTIKFVNGVQTVVMGQEVARIRFSVEQQQLKALLDDLPSDEIYLLVAQQSIRGEVVSFYVGDLDRSIECPLNLTNEAVRSSLTCYISSMSRELYRQMKEKGKDQDGDIEQLHQHLGKAISPKQTRDGVRVEDSVVFEKVEKWLQGQIAQHQLKLQEKRRIQREEQQKRRQEELKRATIESFLEQVSRQVAKEERFPWFEVTLKDVEASLKGNPGDKALKGEPRSYWNQLITSHSKAIDKVEDKKSQEELGRLTDAKTAFMRILEGRVQQNIDMEEELIWEAKIQYEANKKPEPQQEASPVSPQQPSPVEGAPQATKQAEGDKKEEKEEEPDDVIEEFDEFLEIKDEREMGFFCLYVGSLLHGREPKDKQFYREIVRQFWGLPDYKRQALVLLK